MTGGGGPAVDEEVVAPAEVGIEEEEEDIIESLCREIEYNLKTFCIAEDNRPAQLAFLIKLHFALYSCSNCNYKSYINERGNSDNSIVDLLSTGLARLLGKNAFKRYFHINKILNILKHEQNPKK